MKRRLTLALQLVVIDVCALADDYLRHRIGEVLPVAQRDVGLDDRGARVPTGHDQIPRMTDAFTTGNKNQVDGLLDDGVVGQLDESAVGDERGIEGGEGCLLELRHLPQVLLDRRLTRFYRVGQTADAYTIASILERRKALVENSVDEDQSMPVGLPEAESLEISRF